jgi:putative flippase GtrA
MREHLKKHAEKYRFGAVGVANTVIDFGILFLLVHLGVNEILANYISTGTAFIFSFFVNRSFTFKSKDGNVAKQFITFLVVTMFGLWVIQPLIIAGILGVTSGWHFSSDLMLLGAKLTASVASLIWNYIMYARFVFKKKVSE